MQADFGDLYTILLVFYITVIVPRWEAQIMLHFYKGHRSTWCLCTTWYICKDKDPFQQGILPLKNYNLRRSNHKNHRIRERLVSEEILHIIYFQPTCCGEGYYPPDHEQRGEGRAQENDETLAQCSCHSWLMAGSSSAIQ